MNKKHCIFKLLLKKWLLSGVFLSFSAIIFAQNSSVVIQKNTLQPYKIENCMAILHDSSGKLSAKTVLSPLYAEKWSNVPKTYLQLGLSNDYIWAKIKVKTVDTAVSLIWATDMTTIQDIRFFELKNDSIVRSLTTGINYPFAQRAVEHRYQLFPIDLQKADSSVLLLRLHNDVGSMFVVNSLQTKEVWEQVNARENILWTVCISFLAIAGLFSFGLFMAFKERIYGFYTAYISFLMLYLTSNGGFTFQYLWHDYPLMAFMSKILWMLGSLFFLLCFEFSLLSHAIGKIKWLRVYLYILLGLISSFVLFIFLRTPLWFFKSILPLIHLTSLSTIIYIIILLIAAIQKNFRPAYYFLVAFSPVFLVLVGTLLRNYNIVDIEILKSPFPFIFAIIGEILLLFLALLKRFQNEKLEKQLLEQYLEDIKQQQQANIEERLALSDQIIALQRSNDSNTSELNQKIAQMLLISEKLSQKYLLLVEESSNTAITTQSSQLPEARAKEILANFKQLMLEKEAYLNPEISLSSVATQLGVPAPYISQVVNKHEGKSFNDYVNYLRVKRAQTLILSDQSSVLSFEGIGLQSGFASRSTFYSVFKKVTNYTPSEYKKLSQ